MQNNLDKYRNDLNKLTKSGDLLQMAIECECFPERYKKALGEKAEEVLQTLPKFCDEYQSWYSQAKAVIKQLLPDRLDDFVRYYEKPKSRKDINYESYRIEDYLQGLSLTRGHERQKVVGPDAAIKQFKQQLAILKSVSVRLESSLSEIKQLVQADLFDSELEAALSLTRLPTIRNSLIR